MSSSNFSVSFVFWFSYFKVCRTVRNTQETDTLHLIVLYPETLTIYISEQGLEAGKVSCETNLSIYIWLQTGSDFSILNNKSGLLPSGAGIKSLVFYLLFNSKICKSIDQLYEGVIFHFFPHIYLQRLLWWWWWPQVFCLLSTQCQVMSHPHNDYH